ncbi:MAG: phosphatase PAP2 family protein [Mycobacteriales bacterium]
MTTVLTAGTRLASGDRHDFTVINDFARRTGWLHGPMTLYAKQGVLLFALLLVVGYLLARASGRVTVLARSLLAGAGVLLAVAVNQPIVQAVHEARPYRQLPHTLLLVSPSMDASFPSDHAVMAGATAVGLLLTRRWLGALATFAALLMAFARVYVGAHFPIDVLAGLVVGGVVAAGVQGAAAPFSRLLLHLEHGRLRPLLTSRVPAPPAGSGG